MFSASELGEAQPMNCVVLKIDRNRHLISAGDASPGPWLGPDGNLSGRCCCELFGCKADASCRQSGPAREMVVDQGGERWLVHCAPLPQDAGTTAPDERVAVLRRLLNSEDLAEQLSFRKAFEALLYRVTRRLIRLPGSDLDAGIDVTLADLGQFLNVDRCYLFSIDQQAETLANTHEWCRDGIASQIDRLRKVAAAELPWFWRKIQKRSPLAVPAVDLLPEAAAADRDHWQRQGIQALLVVPVLIEDDLCGFIGLDQVGRSRSWQRADLVLLNTVGEILAAVLDRQRLMSSSCDLQQTNRMLAAEAQEHQQLVEKLQKLNQAVEQSPCAIVITDLDGRIEYVNPKFCQVSGYTVEEVLGWSPGVLKGEDAHTDYRQLWQTLLAGKEWRGEFHNRRKDGSYFWEMASISPVWNQRGEVTHYLAVKEDITTRKELEAEVRRERDELKTAQQQLQAAYDELKATQSQMLQQEKMASIGQLAAGVAHEINNPIGFIKSNLSTLQKYASKLTAYLEHLEGAARHQTEATAEIDTMRSQLKIGYLLDDAPELIAESLDGIDRVRVIVQNLKNFSRIDQAERSHVDLNDCLEGTINIVWNELKYKVTLERNYGDLPPVLCYPQQLNQVFMNILVNAAQAIEKQGTISIVSESVDHRVKIVISDDGCGMSDEAKKRLFEPFYTTKPVGQGTGLGMSIVYDIIKKHSGHITVDSQVGKGTSFTIEIPLGDDPA